MAYADFIGPQRTTIIESWQRKRCSYQAVYDPPGPGWYGCSLTLYYSPSSSCPSTSSVRGHFTAQDCGWPNSCNYYGSACVVTKTFDGVEGCTQGEPGCTRAEETTNLPPATVSGSFSCTTPGANGWCIGGGALDLSASEPLTGYVITLIENDTGTLCDPADAANVACTWDQGVDGNYTVEFWAHSSYGDTSAKGSAVWRQDTAGPVSTFTDPLEGSTTPVSGVVNLSGTSTDTVSGVAGAEVWVEGGGGWQPLEVVNGAWNTAWDTSTVPDGTYSVQVRAVDLASNEGDPAEVFLEVDNQAPVVEPAPRSTDPTHPHAIAEVQNPGGTDTYGFDTSGNQTARSEGGVTYNQTVDGEGRLVSLQNTTSGETWTFVYDGDGNRIRQVNPDGTSTLFLAGGLYEVTLDAGGQLTGMKRYYAIGGQPIALRDGSGTFYLLADHLGSVVAVLDGSGTVVGEQRYRPFGQPRLTAGITQTDRGYTGQQSLVAAGLQDFNARWFDTSLGTFASPDSVISDPFDPQGLSRYGYAFNNPLRFTDPSGHRPCEYDLDSCRPAPAPVALRGTTVYGQGSASARLGRVSEEREEPPGHHPETPPENPTILSTPEDHQGPVQGDQGGIDALFLFWNEVVNPLFDVIEPLDVYINYGLPVYKQVRYILPTGPIEAAISGLGQGYHDRDRPELSVGQRVARVFLAGFEAGVTDAASSVAGAVGAASVGSLATAIGPEAAAPGAAVGYAVYAYSTSLALDLFWTETFNPLTEGFLGGWP